MYKSMRKEKFPNHSKNNQLINKSILCNIDNFTMLLGTDLMNCIDGTDSSLNIKDM